MGKNIYDCRIDKKKACNYLCEITTACLIILFLSINHWATKTYDNISQIGELSSLCSYGAIALGLTAIIMYFNKRVNIELPQIVLICITTIGFVESCYALLQLYGFSDSQHGIFKLTGSFFNPGPLGGYIAACIPAAYHLLILLKKNAIYYFILIALIAMLIVEPSTMSRSGWLSAILGTMYIYFNTHDTVSIIKQIDKKRALVICCSIAITIVIVLIYIWNIKKQSALGRLFLWKISSLAILQAPITGSESFAEAYSKAVESYFSKGGYYWEKYVAGNPDFAFNEYLHFSITWGIPAVLTVIMILIATLYIGHKKKLYGICGTIISLATFSFFSYNMHLPSFVALLLVAVMTCWGSTTIKLNLTKTVLSTCAALVLWKCHGNLENRIISMTEWEKASYYYITKDYNTASSLYEPLMGNMKWNCKFMYEYAHILHCIKDYNRSNNILKNTLHLTTDSRVLNLMGKNFHAIGDYPQAEICYKRSLSRLPERIYPHYLLYLLYGDDNYKDAKKQRQEADIILNHTWKVESSATREIREKVRTDTTSLKQVE